MSTSRRQPYGPRSGAIIAAVWLIGLGLVFLIQQAFDMPWADAWPMFVILVGAGSLASVLVAMPYGRASIVAVGWPVFLIAIGVLFLLATTGVLGVGVGELITEWWPLALIILGGWFLLMALLPWGRGPIWATTAGPDGRFDLAVPLAGAASATVKVRFGGGELAVGPAPSGSLLTGSLEGAPARTNQRGPGSVDVEPEFPTGWSWDRTPHWQLGVAADVPLELGVESGAARVRLDLSTTLLRRLRIATGASDTRVALPRAAGETFVRAEGGAASLTFEVPAGVAARIRSRMALGSSQVDETRFPRAGNGWESPDWGTATNRVEIDVQGGVGSVRVVSLG